MTPIAKLIEEKGLRKNWVAEKTGIARGTLSLIINGRSDPTLKIAIRLARLLETTVEDLWGQIADEDA